MTCGIRTSHKHLADIPLRGLWLPECAYRPAMPDWLPAVLYNDPRPRVGLERIIAGAGINHFFVDSHMIAQGQALGTWDAGHFNEVGEAQIHWDAGRGWRDPLQPVGVASDPGPPACFALPRHPRVSEQVW